MEPSNLAAEGKKKALQCRSRAQWEDLVRLAGGPMGRAEALQVVRAKAEDMGYTELPKLSKDRINKRSSQVEHVSPRGGSPASYGFCLVPGCPVPPPLL